jgi:Ca2+:H+ antiporter
MQEESMQAKREQDVEAARQRDPNTTKHIEADGESGRSWFNPLKFARICFRSSCKASMITNILWPFTIAAMVLHFHFRHQSDNIELWIFITAYIGMVPAANLVGFAGQELARKLPKVLGVILETTFGSLVEIVLFMVLLKQPGNSGVSVIRAAILGSILANLLLCLGLCFFIGGIFHPNQTFHEAISEVGSNLMLVAGMGLVIPSIFYNSLSGNYLAEDIEVKALHISRITAIVLLVAFFIYMWFQIRSHHGLYEDILEADEKADHDRHKDLMKDKLTFTEAIIGVAIGVTFVSFMAVFLAQQIEVSYPFPSRSTHDTPLTHSSSSSKNEASATALWD